MWRISEVMIERSPTRVRPAVELALRTVENMLDDRVPGLAAEVAFFVLLSLPPLLLLALGTVGFIGGAVPGFADAAAERLLGLAAIVLTDDTVNLLRPVVEGVLTEGRGDLASLGVILTLYSASRALHVIVVALAIAYDLPEQRRHVAAPWTTPWRRDLPGAVLAVALWLAGSAGLRVYALGSVVSDPVFAPLAGPLVLLLWLYVSAFAVLLGAELNAEIERMWPTIDRERAAERAASDGDAHASRAGNDRV